MQCPYCHHDDTSVLESRITAEGGAMRRRRECVKCNKRFTTYERAEGVDIKVVKKSGKIEDFDREKLRRGIMKATWKRPVTMEQIEEMVDEIERILRRKNSTEVRSWEVGNLVINRLKKIDPLAYLLFASVYREFESLADFEEEIKKLQEVAS
ncbi:transcriptional regulator NrdR [Candidatus Collierbacteria bacterium CG10_big_fil_rev_8_21_14_0_10_44_9]|uniref:Transcriptional repressor NrdR n=1 Tax=Candidatus Collierbacteria bacterium CG10_big_fil_rev_8_21_14_0_10_44_9 TaxID=1974535 RepID=A0A2H0VIW6_9BACT|nr:MAG: transcriptional regulator NrdR [Candidatus Collierbacteria bacterium CG10_big_fil_rev_8_21_14_0_10_44_9]